MQRKMLALSAAGLIGLVIFVGLLTLTRKPSFHGAVISPPYPAKEISLTDHNGKAFKLSEQRGKVVLLYFGYINCPDECPLYLSPKMVALQKSILAANLAGKVERGSRQTATTRPVEQGGKGRWIVARS